MNAPAAVKTFLDGLPAGGRVAWRGDLYTLTTLAGVVYRWTTADGDIKIGANTWSANLAVQRRSNIRKTSRLEIDNLQIDLSALVQLSGKSIGLLAAQGTFYGARLQLDHLVGPDAPTALSYGPILAWYEGRVAATQLAANVVRMTVESDLGALDRFALPQFKIDLACSHAVYDPGCTLVRGTFTDTGTASGTLSTTQVQSTTAALIARANNYYLLGVVTFTSGALSGQKRAIKAFSVSGGTATITLALPFTAAPAATDPFSIYPGCPRTLTACTAFPNALGATNNLVNFRGFPHTPVPAGGR